MLYFTNCPKIILIFLKDWFQGQIRIWVHIPCVTHLYGSKNVFAFQEIKNVDGLTKKLEAFNNEGRLYWMNLKVDRYGTYAPTVPCLPVHCLGTISRYRTLLSFILQVPEGRYRTLPVITLEFWGNMLCLYLNLKAAFRTRIHMDPGLIAFLIRIQLN